MSGADGSERNWAAGGCLCPHCSGNAVPSEDRVLTVSVSGPDKAETGDEPEKTNGAGDCRVEYDAALAEVGEGECHEDPRGR